MNTQVVTPKEIDNLIDGWCKDGTIPPRCKRLVIDFQKGGEMRVYFECYGHTEIASEQLIGLLERSVKQPIPEGGK